jgi:hypothetical protein
MHVKKSPIHDKMTFYDAIHKLELRGICVCEIKNIKILEAPCKGRDECLRPSDECHAGCVKNLENARKIKQFVRTHGSSERLSPMERMYASLILNAVMSPEAMLFGQSELDYAKLHGNSSIEKYAMGLSVAIEKRQKRNKYAIEIAKKKYSPDHEQKVTAANNAEYHRFLSAWIVAQNALEKLEKLYSDEVAYGEKECGVA